MKQPLTVIILLLAIMMLKPGWDAVEKYPARDNAREAQVVALEARIKALEASVAALAPVDPSE